MRGGISILATVVALFVPGMPAFAMQDAQAADNVESLNPSTMYDAFFAPHREGTMLAPIGVDRVDGRVVHDTTR
jgi:hypothetical protein